MTGRSPVEVPTQASCQFLAANLAPASRVLEVGCGAGHVAQKLACAGHHWTGIDADPSMVALAHLRGVSAIEASWPDVEVEPVDAIVFSRSLHHIHELEAALLRAHELLKPPGLEPSGCLLVEDFAFDQATDAMIRWFVERLRTPEVASHLLPVEGEFVTTLLASDDPLATWHRDHDHDLHTAAAMRTAIAERFDLHEEAHAPYLYRYLVPVLPATPAAAELVEEMLREESRLGADGNLELIGRRLVARA